MAFGPSATNPGAAPGNVALEAPPADGGLAPIGLARRVDRDAAAGRAYFADTALTSPQGSFSLGLRMPAGPAANLELRAALTDRIEVAVSGLGVAGEDDHLLGVQVKGQVWHNDRAAAAISLQHYHWTDGGGVTIPSIVASSCLDGADCLVLVSLSLEAIAITDEDELPIFVGASWALGRAVQFVGEAHVSNDRGNSFLFGYLGVRANGSRVAVDGGVAFATAFGDVCYDVGCADDTIAYPFFALSTRM